MHIHKDIFAFFNQREQIDFSKISRKFYRIYYLCSQETESLVIIKNELLPEKYLYFIFSKFPIFINVKKIYLHSINLNKSLLEFLYKLDFKNLKKFKVVNCSFITESPEKTANLYGTEFLYGWGFSYANAFKFGLELFEFIQKFTAYEKFYLQNFRFFMGQKEIRIGIPVFFRLGLTNLKKLVIKNCNLTSVQMIDIAAHDMYRRFPNLEVIDFSENPINSYYLDEAMLAFIFPNSKKIKKVFLNNCKINFNFNMINFSYLQNFNGINAQFNRSYPNFELLDVSRNNASSDDYADFFYRHRDLLKKIFPNLLIKTGNLLLKLNFSS